MKGKFFPKTVGGEQIVGDVILAVSFEDNRGDVLGRSMLTVRQGDLGFGYSAPIGRAAPAQGGVDVNALARVVLRTVELKTREGIERDRQGQQQTQAASAEAARLKQIRSRKWPAHIEKAVIDRKVMVGMTAEQVTLAWGKPNRLNRSVGVWGRHEQWIYGSTFLYFENEVLTSYQESR